MTKTPFAAEPGPFSELPPVRVSSPADVLAVVPHLLGFHPDNSFVVIGAGRPRERIEVAFRYDLPDPPDAGQAADIAEHAVTVLRQRKLSTVIAVGYGPGERVTPVADALTGALRRGGPRLRELMRVEDGRYWSYLCANPDCCPADGVRFDVQANPAAAAMTVAGLVAYPDRAALAGTLAPVAGAVALAMEQATGRARAREAELAGRPAGRATVPATGPLVEAGRRAVADALAVYRAGGQLTEDDQLAWLSVVLAHLPVRDDAWSRMDPEHREAHLRLWTDLVRRARRRYLAAPASLLAFTAWQSGEGALANIAVDLALAADPGYSLPHLLRDIMDAGVPPSAARLPMTPEQVAASYDLTEAATAAAPPRPAGRGRRAARQQRGR